MRAWLGVAFFLAATTAASAAEPPLVADLSEHLVAVTTGFAGTAVTLFGTTEADGDIVVTVRGPEREALVRRKSDVAGIWLNLRSIVFVGVPSYYAVLSSKPIETITTAELRRQEQIGIDALKLDPKISSDPPVIDSFRSAMVEGLETSGLYLARPGQVTMVGAHLFRATLTLPAAVPIGSYAVQVLVVRKGAVVARQTLPLVVAQSGFEATIHDFAVGQPAFYGLVAVAAAAMAGWFASFVSRSAG